MSHYLSGLRLGICLISITLLAASCSPFGDSTQFVGGISKTVNGGADWQFINKIKNDDTLSLAGVDISVLQFAPNNRERVYAATYDNGLYYSEDSGDRWTQILSKLGVQDVALDPKREGVIYAAGVFGGNGKLLQTVDGGKSWIEVYNEAVLDNPVRSVALNPNATNEVYIGLASGNVIKSQDGGKNWKLMYNFGSRINRVRYYFGSLYVMVQDKGLWLSRDGGTTFVDLTASLPKAGTYYYNISGSVDPIGNFSQFVLSSDNKNLIYITTDRGLYKTINEGKSWQYQKLPVESNSVVTRAIAISPKNDNIVMTSINATVYKSLDGGNSWQTHLLKTDGFVNYILIDPEITQIMYAGIYLQ